MNKAKSHLLSTLCGVVLALSLPALVSAEGPNRRANTGFVSSKALFAGGNFWYIQEGFDGVDGVFATRVGFMGGKTTSPSFTSVDEGGTGHYHVIEIRYNSTKITFGQLLNIFWKQIDPTDDGGQFEDRGDQFRTAIFYYGEQQRAIALRSIQSLQASKRFGDKPIVTQVLPASNFFQSRDPRHLNFHRRYAEQYKQLRYITGRDAFLQRIWGGTQ